MAAKQDDEAVSTSRYAGIFIVICLVLFAGLQQFLPGNYKKVIGVTMCVSLGGIAFAAYLAGWVMSHPEGSAEMIKIAQAIREGADGFLKTQYTAIAKMAVVVEIIIIALYMMHDPPGHSKLTKGQLASVTAVSFAVGASLSAMCGYVGMWCAVRANSRVGASALPGNPSPYNAAIQMALRSGAIAAVLVVSFALLGICLLFSLFAAVAGGIGGVQPHKVPLLLVGYGFGASFVALFAQLGGGIYTKAADVGADLVGKVEQDIPEDDPRNPAVIADLVGDNVGDCAGRGADLFESIAAEIVAAMILGGFLMDSALKDAKVPSEGYVLFPLAVHSMDIIVSSIGVMLVKTNTHNEDPMQVLTRGWFYSVSLATVGFFMITRLLLHTDVAPDAWWHFALCGLVGIVTCYLFIIITQYYTDYNYGPVKSIALASTTGHGTNVIAGMAVGMESTCMPVLTISGAILTAYYLGQSSGLMADGEPTGGLFGTAVATMGMLSTAVYVLAMDVFGPIADNAGGIVEMDPGADANVRKITDRLDAVGNTTKAITKGYAVGSASLACFLLFSAFMDEVTAYSGKPFKVVDIAQPEVFVAGLCGAMLVYLFSGMCMKAVGVTAQEIVKEVRAQFAANGSDIMDGTMTPNYQRCVEIVTVSALREMRLPGMLAAGAPIFCGLFFRFLSSAKDPLLGAKCASSFLMFGTVSGVLMALFLNNAGGAWDNAKKYVEDGNHGGKGSEAHKASVTGDTVGDPCKDTAGPSLHVLIKLLSTVTLVCAPAFVSVVH